MRGIVFARAAAEVALVERSERSLARAGVPLSEWCFGEHSLGMALGDTTEPLLLLQAGAWLLNETPLTIPPSATGLPLAAFEKAAPGEPGGGCVYLEPAAARCLAAMLRENQWCEALRALRKRRDLRRIELPELRTGCDPALRALQVVTTIQVGGAERVTLDLAEELNRQGQRCWVAALGKPPRASFPRPNGFYDVAPVGRSIAARAEVFARITRQQHLDVLHGHLLSADEMQPLLAAGLPLAVTIHNLPQSWPREFAGAAHQADLLIACCRAVESATLAAELGAPCRTAWNGIAAGRFAMTQELLAEGGRWREEQGWGEDDLVLIAVANPRRQKRLERIPEIVSALQRCVPERRVRAIIAGEAARTSADGAGAQAALDRAIAEHQAHANIRQIGGAEKVRLLLAASDVFLSVSAFEGLSLAQLEALAAGLPVVATDTGGAPEIAREMHARRKWYRTVPVDASAAEFAAAIVAALRLDGAAADEEADGRSAEGGDVPGGPRSHDGRASRLPAAFERSRMVSRTEGLYRAMLSRRLRERRLRERRQPRGLWLITNNFSMGGAQSSARRLLETLHARGIPVRAFTVQEETATRGAQSLAAGGIRVTAIAPLHLQSPSSFLTEMLAHAAADPPQAVLFWNLITSCKVRLADALEGVRFYDVSPGEMYFQSLEHYFAKPLAALPYRTPREYGARLAGAVVKFAREQAVAEEALGCRVSVIRNGIALPPAPARRTTGTKLVFGTAARISPDKRLEELLAAFAIAHPALPLYELHIAGRVENGAAEYAQSLRRQAAGLPVVWRGELPGTAEFLRELDVFVMISEPAGCPNASLEALAAGVPVIATDAGGAHEQVIDRETGRLTPRNDNDALAAAILELAADPAARTRYGAAGREHVAHAFSLDRMADEYAALCLGAAPAEASLNHVVQTS